MIITRNLDNNLYAQIKQLEKICSEYDNSDYKLICEKEADDIVYLPTFSDDGRQLISIVSYIQYDDSLIEMSALTHPAFRGRGLVDHIIDCLPDDIPIVYTLSEAMDTSRHAYEYSELLLKLIDKPNISDDTANYIIKVTASIDHTDNYTMFDNEANEIGHLKVLSSDESICIFDVYIKEEYRHKGLCRILLSLAYLKLNSSLPIILHVNSLNEYAVRVYISFGFVVDTEIKYYSL